MTTPPAAGAARTPWQVLQDVLRADAAAPRVTFYERTPGPAAGERVELSAKVLVNWVSKAANLLVEEFDVAPGVTVVVHLPAAHWRTSYWCLAAWSAGAGIVFVDADAEPELPDLDAVGDADVLVTSAPGDTFDGDVVVVTLAMLSRACPEPLPPGAVDEARELSTFTDSFAPLAAPDVDAIALSIASDAGADGVSFTELLTPVGTGERRHLPAPDPHAVMGTLVAGGSIVLVRGDIEESELAHMLAQEGVVSR